MQKEVDEGVKNKLPLDTEQKIKAAAKEVFLRKGFHGAKVKDIAEAAGVNIALMNYYFRSKEQLFEQIFLETFISFFGKITTLFNEETPLEVKIWKVVDQYTDFVIENPLLPVFVLSEMQKNELTFFKQLDVASIFKTSFFARQLREEAALGNIRAIDPLHLLATMMGSIVFPVVARPMLQHISGMGQEQYKEFLIERKQITPRMIMAYLKPD
jgi:AcrR family transcriptional regulator